AAVVIASEHPERERLRAREGVEEGLLLDGVELQPAHVAVGHHQRTPPVEAGRDEAAVAAGEAAHAALGQLLVELAFARVAGEQLAERGLDLGHGSPSIIAPARLTRAEEEAKLKRKLES